MDDPLLYALCSKVNLTDVNFDVISQWRQRDWKPLCPFSKGESLGYNLVQLKVYCYHGSEGFKI